MHTAQFGIQRIERLLSDIRTLINVPVEELSLLTKKGFFASPQEAHHEEKSFCEFPMNGRWGERDSYVWFSTTYTITCELQKQERLYISVATEKTQSLEAMRIESYVMSPHTDWDLSNPQFLLFLNGTKEQGLDQNHLLASFSSRKDPLLHIDLQGYSGNTERDFGFHVTFGYVDLKVESFHYDFLTAFQVAQTMDETNIDKERLLQTLLEGLNMLDLRQVRSHAFYESLEMARTTLAKTWESLFGHEIDSIVNCVGHTHIDVAWLWNLNQTRQKVRRSFSTVLKLMERYPDFTFFQSSPQLYSFVQETDPDLYQDIKKRVAEGRWEVDGAMWLEADCNIPSGESLVRQILFGKQFFKKEFNKTSHILWLPDVFGYSAALPQILKKAGIDCFITSKISWNAFNKMPYDLFRWKGINGDEIHTYFLTAPNLEERSDVGSTYSGIIHPKVIKQTWERFNPKSVSNNTLLAYGYGDGGGGPTENMLEQAKRLTKNAPGLPHVVMSSLRTFVDNILRQSKEHADKLPVWNGELYLELHQGTYTSMATIKKNNRKAEQILHDTEFLASLAWLSKGEHYPQISLEKLWKILLLNQFHDTLPGSCIEQVYHDSEQQFSQLFHNAGQLILKAMHIIAKQDDKMAITCFNTLGFSRNAIILLPQSVSIATEEGSPCKVQYLHDGKTLVQLEKIPALGFQTYRINSIDPEQPAKEQESSFAYRISVPFFDVEFSKDGEISSLFAKQLGRNIVKDKANFNALVAYDDRPSAWDSWNIDPSYEDLSRQILDLQSIQLIEEGPLRTTVRIRRNYSASTINQDIYFSHTEPTITFETTVNWQEDATLLKVIFPTDIISDHAKFQIQFGSLERPTHYNTSWDMAKYEVCAQQWMDLSETNWGISLINDCKYGCDIHEGTLRLSLLKSGMAPWAKIDRGIQKFSYMLYIHDCPWHQARTTQLAADFNTPVSICWQKKPRQGTFSLINTNSDAVLIDTIKQTEDGKALLVRMYETTGQRTTIQLTFGMTPISVEFCNLLEETEIHDLPNLKENIVTLAFKPFEIISLRITF